MPAAVVVAFAFKIKPQKKLYEKENPTKILKSTSMEAKAATLVLPTTRNSAGFITEIHTFAIKITAGWLALLHNGFCC